jgi:tRNA U34 5-methylaminomethyl-2-thiouridine-forming methyltransferase MnmC
MVMVWTPQLTQDGSYTFFSEVFGETFHSVQGAKAEAFQKFVAATGLADKARLSSLRLLDVCYGLGYNTAAALETILSINSDCQVELYGLEQDPTVPLGALVPELLVHWSPQVQVILSQLAQAHTCQQKGLTAQLWMGDARQRIQQLGQIGFQADAIFFDPFSPQRCPQLWTVEFVQATAQCLAPSGKLATYSRSAAVRTALSAAGLCVGTLRPPAEPLPLPHQWAQGTVAAWQPDGLMPLSSMEQEHLHTRAAVPFRDPTLNDEAAVILARQRREQEQCGLESTSAWRRRWHIH